MYCRRYFPVDIVQVDHKHPLSRGGSDDMGNLQVLCPSCNSSKGSYTDKEYREHAGIAPVESRSQGIVTLGRAVRRRSGGAIEPMIWVPVRLNGVSVGYIKQVGVGADWKVGRQGSWSVDSDLTQAIGLTFSDDLLFDTREKAVRAVEAIATRASAGYPVIDKKFLTSAVGTEMADKIIARHAELEGGQTRLGRWGCILGAAAALGVIVALLWPFIVPIVSLLGTFIKILWDLSF